MLKSVVIREKKFKHSPMVGADNPLGQKNLCQQEGLITMVICCKFKKNLTLYTSFHDLINVQGSPFIMLCLGSIELDRVISELCYKGIIL